MSGSQRRMPEFKVGDRVRAEDGDEGIVTRIAGEVIWADFETAGNAYDNAFALKLVDRPLKNFTGDEETPFEQSVRRHTDRIATLLIEKNKAYGDSALNPIRVFSKADRMEQLYIRLDDKLSRVQKGHEYPGDDTIQDIIGYCLLVLIARESA